LIARLYGAARTSSRGARGFLGAQGSPREVFEALWWRLVSFAREDALAFRFLELQDHTAYLDGESRQLSVSAIAPLYTAFLRLQEAGLVRSDLRPDAILALVWGALVGLFKNERLGYVQLDDATLRAVADALFAGLLPQTPRTRKK
jgi:hypothetical protein